MDKKAGVSPLVYMIMAIIMAVILIAVAVLLFKGIVSAGPMS